MDSTDDKLLGALAKARALGFLGPGPVEDHLRHAMAFVSAVADLPGDTGEGADLGSGGGLPGLVLATRLAGWRWTLIDASQRRTAFLQAAAAQLGVSDRVRVVRRRAEYLGREPSERARYDVVVARSFGSPGVTAEAAAPLLRPSGVLLVSEPPEVGVRWPDEEMRVGLVFERRTAEVGGLAILRQRSACPAAYPRRWAVQQRRPLF